MATTSRQTAIFGVEDWKRIYQTYQEADFQSYDFETLRKSFVDYLRVYYPETFNDYIESSEFIALLDVMAFMGQSLAFRTDLNTRENYLDTAERRDSVVRWQTWSVIPQPQHRSIRVSQGIFCQHHRKHHRFQRHKPGQHHRKLGRSYNLDWQEQFTPYSMRPWSTHNSLEIQAIVRTYWE
jgi:hypothetical protein